MTNEWETNEWGKKAAPGRGHSLVQLPASARWRSGDGADTLARTSGMSELPFQFVNGAVHIPEVGLWLDAHRSVTGSERVLVSHAHSDHTAAHREVILTAATAQLMRSRLGRGRRVEHHLPF